MKMSGIFDIALILKDSNGLYYELVFDGYALEQPDDFPVQCFLKKGKRIYKKELNDYTG